MMTRCTASSLRHTNLLATMAVALVAAQCRSLVEARTAKPDVKSARGASLYAFHTAFNIALFPVIFFFSGLYYTDVASTLAVLVAFKNHLARLGNDTRILDGLWTVLLGVVALFMRQTNVFWVVVYMGGVEAVHAIRSIKPAPVEPPKGPLSIVEHIKFYVWRDSVGELHDPTLNKSNPEGEFCLLLDIDNETDCSDWLFCVLSIGIAALCNPLRVLKQVWPHITILALFGGFVVWNGGVVLGSSPFSWNHSPH